MYNSSVWIIVIYLSEYEFRAKNVKDLRCKDNIWSSRMTVNKTVFGKAFGQRLAVDPSHPT
jgi:hypothetical protein